MPRTVVPPVPPRQRVRGESDADSLPEKLVKYVPAETLAFFVPASALAGGKRDGLLIAAVVIGVLGTAGWLWTTARDLPADKRPRPHFYVLASLAFLAWSLATAANVAAMVGADPALVGFVLCATVFLVPLADTVLNETVDW